MQHYSKEKLKKAKRDHWIEKHQEILETLGLLLLAIVLFPLFYVFALACFAVPSALIGY